MERQITSSPSCRTSETDAALDGEVMRGDGDDGGGLVMLSDGDLGPGLVMLCDLNGCDVLCPPQADRMLADSKTEVKQADRFHMTCLRGSGFPYQWSRAREPRAPTGVPRQASRRPGAAAWVLVDGGHRDSPSCRWASRRLWPYAAPGNCRRQAGKPNEKPRISDELYRNLKKGYTNKVRTFDLPAGYVLAVAASRRVTTLRALARCASSPPRCPAGPWQRYSASECATGRRYYDWAWLAIDPGRPGHHHLLIRRSRHTGEHAYYRCYSPAASRCPRRWWATT